MLGNLIIFLEKLPLAALNTGWSKIEAQKNHYKPPELDNFLKKYTKSALPLSKIRYPFLVYKSIPDHYQLQNYNILKRTFLGHGNV